MPAVAAAVVILFLLLPLAAILLIAALARWLPGARGDLALARLLGDRGCLGLLLAYWLLLLGAAAMVLLAGG